MTGIIRTANRSTGADILEYGGKVRSVNRGEGSAPIPSDPEFANVSLLLPFNGTNGSTSMTDASSNGLTVTAFGNAQISTAQSKWGGSSLLLDGSGDYLDVATSLALDFGTGDLTVEFWYFGTSAPNSSPFRRIISSADTSGGLIGLHIWHAGTTATGATVDAIEWTSADVTSITASTQTAVSDGAWHHIAFTRQSGTVRAFFDGVLKQTGTFTNGISLFQTRSMRIGGRPDLAAGTFTNGYIDDMRITNTVARYTSSFSVPTDAFPTS